jgi:hypothetical protein
MPHTTDPGTAADWLRREAPRASAEAPRILIYTYASGEVAIEAVERYGMPLPRVAYDEAHRTAGVAEMVRETVWNATATRLRAVERRFLTATPVVHNDAVKDAYADQDVVSHSMDNEAVYGPVLFDYPYTEARDDGVVVPFQFVTGIVDDPALREMVASKRLELPPEFDGDSAAHLNDLASAHFTLHAALGHGLRSVLTVHNSVPNAQLGARLMRAVAGYRGIPVDALVLHGNSDGAQWRRVRASLSDPERLTMVSFCRVLGEGIDIPMVDAVSFFERRSSVRDVNQVVGRAVRTAEGKDAGYVLMPVYFEEGASLDDALAASRFANVHRVLSALRDRSITPRQKVVLRKAESVNPNPPETMEVSVELAREFDSSMLVYGMETLVSSGTWGGYAEALADAASLDAVTLYGFMRRLYDDLRVVGATHEDAKQRTREDVFRIIREAGGDAAAVISAVHAFGESGAAA